MINSKYLKLSQASFVGFVHPNIILACGITVSYYTTNEDLMVDKNDSLELHGMMTAIIIC